MQMKSETGSFITQKAQLHFYTQVGPTSQDCRIVSYLANNRVLTVQ